MIGKAVLLKARNTILETLGTDLTESMYVNALCVELAEHCPQKEYPVPLVYKGALLGTLRADIVIFGKLDKPVFVIECKSTTHTLASHKVQLERYAKLLDVPGALVNFNQEKTERSDEDVVCIE